MTPEQKQTILDFIERSASGFDWFDFDLRKAAAAMLADMEAMRQSITEEALKANGRWTHESTGLYRDDVVNAGDDITSIRLFVDFCNDDPPGVYLGDVRISDAKTMHDLRELVRLLGGQP